MPSPLVAIIGRPNVGKSTLFNRLIKKREAIEEKQPGVTRDRLYGHVSWLDREFMVIDTGGLVFRENAALNTQVQRQARLAIEEASVIIMVVDVKNGVHPLDEEITTILQKAHKSVVLAVNKVDSSHHELGLYSFYTLGLGEPVPISAVHGRNIGDLLDKVIELLPQENIAAVTEKAVKVAVTGKPNVGKSSLVNALLGEERVIVNDLPGTTRDAVNTYLVREDKEYILIDTAGIRRKSKVELPVEYFSILRSFRAIEECDIVLVVLDVTQSIRDQDKKIAGYADEAGKGLILVVNKWDLINKDEHSVDAFTKLIRSEFAFCSYASIIFISAKTGLRVPRIFDLVEKIHNNRKFRVPTGILNELLQDIVMVNPPPTKKGKQLKVYFGTQISEKPPTFVLFVNNPSFIHFSYLRYIENRLRDNFDFYGTPLRFYVRQRRSKGRG